MPGDSDKLHWLVRPRTVRGLWWAFGAILLLTVLAQLGIHIKGYYGMDGWFGFGAGYGFLSCLVMVLVAKLLGWLLKRPDDYYFDIGVEDDMLPLEGDEHER